MDLNIDFNLVRSQKLLLIPQLKQALEILEMSSQELFRHIEEQLEANPAIEIAMEDKPNGEDDDDSLETIRPEDTAETLSLKDHLLLQLNALEPDRLQNMVGEYLIDNTDENGYMTADVCEVAAFFNISAARVCKMLETLQKFDPPGICARNLKECLLIQLRQMEEIDDRAICLVEKHLDKLASNDLPAVAEVFGITPEEADSMFRKVKSLEPRPGREFYDKESAGPLFADVIVKIVQGKPEAVINDEAFPEIELSEDFISSRESCTDDETCRFMQNNVNDAVWLIKCMEQRKDILLKIAGKLIDRIPEFFEKGPGHWKPVDAAVFADILQMHETVLQKALKGKYLQCRWGVFELEYFIETDGPTV